MKQGRLVVAPRPGADGGVGLRNRQHQLLWRQLIPLGFRPRARLRTGLGGVERYGAPWYLADAYHPKLGIVVEILHADEPENPLKRRFLESVCPTVYWLTPKGLPAQVRQVIAELQVRFEEK